MSARYIIRLFSFLFFLLIITDGCSEKEYTGSDPGEAFAFARIPYDEKSYENSIKRLGEFKSRFPYSKHTALADLYIANSHFELEQYEEAAASYMNFLKLHPKNEQIPYAMYRVGESYWSDSPTSIDRDQEYTQKAIDEWQKLIEKFPQDSYSDKARKQVQEGKEKIAKSHEFIADFYCKLEIYHACAYRFMLLSKEYPEFKEIHAKALKRAAMALEFLAKAKEADPESDKNIYFKTMTPDQMKQKAKEMREELTRLGSSEKG